MYKENVLEGLEILRRKVDAEAIDEDVKRDIRDLLEKFEMEVLDVIEGAEENYTRQREVNEVTPIFSFKEDAYDENFKPKSKTENLEGMAARENLWMEYGLK
jgi:DNA-dependent RNA polymerase auxiliary subunit epsilon